MERDGGQLVIATQGPHRPGKQVGGREWVVAYTFGHEEPDNPENDMAAGASYGIGPDLDSALATVFDELGIVDT